MKKYLLAFAVLFTAGVLMSNQMLNTKVKARVSFIWPEGLTTNKQTVFPSYDLQVKTYTDTVAVTATQSATWVRLDTVKGNGLVTFNAPTHFQGGEVLWLQARKDGSSRTLTIKQGATIIDTLPVGNDNCKRQFIYTGSRWEAIK